MSRSMPSRPAPRNTQLLRRQGEETLRGVPGQTLLRRIGLPEDIADVIAAVCSPDRAWVNGRMIFAFRQSISTRSAISF